MAHGIANSISASKPVNTNEGHQLRQGCSSDAKARATKVTAPSNDLSEKRNPNAHDLQPFVHNAIRVPRLGDGPDSCNRQRCKGLREPRPVGLNALGVAPVDTHVGRFDTPGNQSV